MPAISKSPPLAGSFNHPAFITLHWEFFTYTVFYMNMVPVTARLAFLTSLMLQAACVSQDPQPSVQSICPTGTTYSCAVYGGQAQRCACVGRDALREIMDPVNDY